MVLKLIEKRIFIFLMGLGIMGNIFVFTNYMCIVGGTEKTNIHLILIHLVVTNIILLLSKGIKTTLAAFGLNNFLDNTVCKIVVYVERVARGLTICTTCLLTVVQALTISSRASGWKRLKPRSSWHIFLLFIFFWIFNSLISINLLFHIKSISSMNTSLLSKSDKYCYFFSESLVIRSLFITLMVLRDALFQGIMGGASGYMIFLLHKHHQQVFYLQNSRILCKIPPEIKAAQSVLLLMLCYLLVYWTDYFISFYLSLSLEATSIAINVREFLTIAYAILCPFLLIHRDGQLIKCWHTQQERHT